MGRFRLVAWKGGSGETAASAFCAPDYTQGADEGLAVLRPGRTAAAAVSTWFVAVLRVEVLSGDAQYGSCLCKKINILSISVGEIKL